MPLPQMENQLRKGHTVVSKRHGKKVKPNRRFKKNFLFLSCLNCLLSWDKNLINHDFHRRRLREVKLKSVRLGGGGLDRFRKASFKKKKLSCT